MAVSIFNQSKPVYEYLDNGKEWDAYGFYFPLSRWIDDKQVFCFIGDPQKQNTIYIDIHKSKIQVNGQEHLLPLGFKVGDLWLWGRDVLAIPAVIGAIALTTEPLCLSVLESFLLKIELDIEVKNSHHKHSPTKIKEIKSTIQEIESQLELFTTNLGNLFHRIVQERNLLSSTQDFPIQSQIELTHRNEELARLLEQFHQLDP
jgi:hypothetical protein